MRVVLTHLSMTGTPSEFASQIAGSPRPGCNLNRPRTNTKLGTRKLGPSELRYTNSSNGTKDPALHDECKEIYAKYLVRQKSPATAMYPQIIRSH